ncbi:MAG: hypothetical protein HY723_03260, partial [Chloroflexi bacterium]|nr:hypothetical protein [Chloroflexota bacterium]
LFLVTDDTGREGERALFARDTLAFLKVCGSPPADAGHDAPPPDAPAPADAATPPDAPPDAARDARAPDAARAADAARDAPSAKGEGEAEAEAEGEADHDAGRPHTADRDRRTLPQGAPANDGQIGSCAVVNVAAAAGHASPSDQTTSASSSVPHAGAAGPAAIHTSRAPTGATPSARAKVSTAVASSASTASTRPT